MDLGVTEILVPIPDPMCISQVPALSLTRSGIQEGYLTSGASTFSFVEWV